MQLSDIPAWFAKRFGADAGGTYLRQVPATSADPAAASMSLGFPPATFTPVGAGGTPMDGRDMNGILNFLTAWSQWQGVGGPAVWSSAISAAAGGYPQNAVVASATVVGRQYISLVNNNTTNPDTGGAGWELLLTKGATQAEVNAGVSFITSVTPATLAARLAALSFVTTPQMNAAIAAARGTAGVLGDGRWWVKESSGWIRQGGVRRAATPEGSYAISYAIPFPNACYGLQVTGYNSVASAVQDVHMQAGPWSTTGATAFAQYASGGGGGVNQLDGFNWEATGH